MTGVLLRLQKIRFSIAQGRKCTKPDLLLVLQRIIPGRELVPICKQPAAVMGIYPTIIFCIVHDTDVKFQQ